MTRTILFALAVITFAMPTVCMAAEPALTVPEPATGLLLLIGGLGAAAYRQMRKPRG